MDKINIIQKFEQAGAMLGEFASMLGVYHKHLQEHGFTREESMKLVSAYHQSILALAFSDNYKEEG